MLVLVLAHLRRVPAFRDGSARFISRRDWLSGETTSVPSGFVAYSRAISLSRSSRPAISCTRPCWSRLFDRFSHVAAGELFHGFLERRVPLPHDFIQTRGLHSCLL